MHLPMPKIKRSVLFSPRIAGSNQTPGKPFFRGGGKDITRVIYSCKQTITGLALP
jgi:hypothetical protein